MLYTINEMLEEVRKYLNNEYPYVHSMSVYLKKEHLHDAQEQDRLKMINLIDEVLYDLTDWEE